MLFSNQSIKPCLIVLTTKPSASSYKIIDKGVKISQLIKIKKLLNIQNIEWEFATLGGFFSSLFQCKQFYKIKEKSA